MGALDDKHITRAIDGLSSTPWRGPRRSSTNCLKRLLTSNDAASNSAELREESK